MNMKLVYQKMKQIRKERGLTQAKIAARLHMDRTTYTKCENGSVGLSVEKMLEWCQLLNVSPNELLDWESRNKDK